MTSILPLPLNLLPTAFPQPPLATPTLTTPTQLTPTAINPATLKMILSPEEAAAMLCKTDLIPQPSPPTITALNAAGSLNNNLNLNAINAVNSINNNNNNNMSSSTTGTSVNLSNGTLSGGSSSNGSTPTGMVCSPTLPPPLTGLQNLPNDLVTYVPYGIPVTPVSPSQTMELVWHGEFDRLFTQYYPHNWYLVPTFYPPSDRWRVFKDSAKVRFSCQECGHGWTSMKGRVIFWFHLNYSTNSGYVMFKLYGQQCQKCKNGNYEHAMWYPEEVIKVIGNVYNRVGQIFYGFVRPPLRIDRRQGKPRNQHNAELCQACKEGLCKEEWSFS